MTRTRRCGAILFAALCLAAPMAAMEVSFFAADQKSADPIEELRHKAEKESPKKRSKIYIEIVAQLVDRAASEYKREQYSQFSADIKAAGQALAQATDNVKQYHHDEKKDDLLLEPVERKLRDLSQSVALEDRGSVDALLKQVQGARDLLIQLVFQK